jgi:flagellar motor protein MotB
MHKIKTPYFLLVITSGFFLFSCVSQKKVVSAKKDLTAIDSLFLQQNKTLKSLDEQRRNKQELNEIDDTSSSRIQKYINSTTIEIDTLIGKNSILIGETVVNKDDWNRLLRTLSSSRMSSKKIGDKILFLTDLVSQNTVVKIDQDVLFQPGRYTVAPAMANAIIKLFEPAAKEIELFTKRYPDFPLSLVITAKGYADATSISEGSSLYRALKESMTLNATDPDNKELNKQLSRLRAKEVIELFEKFAAGRSGDGTYLKNVLYLYEGKGESLPNPKITDYKVDDSRRRVVYLFWSVFPE